MRDTLQCAVSPESLSVSTLTPREELTLLISLPSSASSRLSTSASLCSGLSPSSIGRSAKSGLRMTLRNAAAIAAASTAENGPPAESARETVDAPSDETTLCRLLNAGSGAIPLSVDCGSPCAMLLPGAALVGDCGCAFAMFAIIGD
jgi:hypothetical protein